MIKILIVDDHELMRAGMLRILNERPDMEVVAETDHSERALRLVRDFQPDVVLMDINVPGLGGLEATRRLLRHTSGPRVIVLGTQRDGPLPSRLLELGATAYLARDCSERELVRAVHRASRGKRYVSEAVARAMVLSQFESEQSPVGALTPRELSVMVMVSQGHNRRQISDKLSLSPKTVSTYRTRVMRKLGASSDVQLTHLSLLHGLINPRLGDIVPLAAGA